MLWVKSFVSIISFLDHCQDVKQLDDWYSVYGNGLYKSIREYGGLKMLQYYYEGSISKALRAIYPRHPWDMSKFSKPTHPSKYWSDHGNQRAFFDEIASKMSIHTCFSPYC